MYRLSEEERTELLQLTRENNKMLRSILTIISHEHSTDFSNNLLANVIGNFVTPNRR